MLTELQLDSLLPEAGQQVHLLVLGRRKKGAYLIGLVSSQKREFFLRHRKGEESGRKPTEMVV